MTPPAKKLNQEATVPSAKQELSQPSTGPAPSGAPFTVKTTTHGKLTSPTVEFLPGWIHLSAPIHEVRPDAESHLLPVAELWLPAGSVKQVDR